MAPSSRSAQFTRLHKILKKHYRPVAVDPERPVLEHLLFACCLENARDAAAEEAFAAMVEAFFDWNEIRVSSVRELAEVMARLPDPPAAAGRLKRVLQHVFEDSYSFDLEDLRKKNLGPAIESLKKIDGTTTSRWRTSFRRRWEAMPSPWTPARLEVMRILGLATDEDVANGSIPGLERAIAKSSGIEFASLLQQLGADFTENPFAPELREKLLEIDPEAKSRLPKRGVKKKAAAEDRLPEPDATASGRRQSSRRRSRRRDREAEKESRGEETRRHQKNPPEEKTTPAKKIRSLERRPPRRIGTEEDALGPTVQTEASLNGRRAVAAWLTWLTNGCLPAFPAIGLLLAGGLGGALPGRESPNRPRPRHPSPGAEAALVARRRARTVCPQNAPDRGRRRSPPRPDALLHRTRARETRAVPRRPQTLRACAAL